MIEKKWHNLYKRIDANGKEITNKNKYYTINITKHENTRERTTTYVRHCRERKHELIGTYEI